MPDIIRHDSIAPFARAGKRVAVILALSIIMTALVLSQDSKQATPPAKPAQAGAQTNLQPASAALPPVQLDSEAVLHHLNQLIGWYRRSTTGIQS
ncbi:MAG: hypothetical protein WBX38_10485, partial [Candidatus Sulfotelmatobacter sp.]